VEKTGTGIQFPKSGSEFRRERRERKEVQREGPIREKALGGGTDTPWKINKERIGKAPLRKN